MSFLSHPTALANQNRVQITNDEVFIMSMSDEYKEEVT
jgi:hypothetical protein